MIDVLSPLLVIIALVAATVVLLSVGRDRWERRKDGDNPWTR